MSATMTYSESISDVNERTYLLRDNGSDARRKSFGSSLRRLSTAGIPPFHEEHEAPTDEPSSQLAIWVVVPISLVGEHQPKYI